MWKFTRVKLRWWLYVNAVVDIPAVLNRCVLCLIDVPTERNFWLNQNLIDFLDAGLQHFYGKRITWVKLRWWLYVNALIDFFVVWHRRVLCLIDVTIKRKFWLNQILIDFMIDFLGAGLSFSQVKDHKSETEVMSLRKC